MASLSSIYVFSVLSGPEHDHTLLICLLFQEKRKAEDALNDLKRQHESEVAELQVTIKKLKKVNSSHLHYKGFITFLEKIQGEIYKMSNWFIIILPMREPAMCASTDC